MPKTQHLRDLLNADEYEQYKRLVLEAHSISQKIESMQKKRTLQTIADEMGISIEQVRRTEKLALQKLRHHPAIQNLKPKT